MKILLVNKFLYLKGGAENYVFKLGKILEEHGHEVQYFGLADENNIVGNAAESYVAPQDFQSGIRKNLTAPFRIIYSSEARKKIRAVLDDFQPDIVHLNNIQFHLTPSIILETHKYRTETKRDVKIIYTAHDYQLICPSHGLFDNDFKVCEKCLGGNYLHCLKTKCVKNSRVKSLLGTIDAYWWKWSKAYSFIDTIVCPSEFLKKKLDLQERFKTKTVALHNFVDVVEPKVVEKEDYVLEFGKLCRDKGTNTLLEVCKRLPDVRFVFAGYGPAEADIAAVPNAEYVGFKSGEELEMLIRKARFSIYPSEWYENCPFSVIESQMYLTPVIGSKMGGIPELIREGETGELFEAANVDDLKNKIMRLWYSPDLLKLYISNCKQLDIETPDSYYGKILNVYTGGKNEDI
ncbi:MAG: glycosyltransferase [Acutalibacteraceae bacterium]